MNTKSLAKHYAQLTPEESFRLVLAANARDDKTEIDRLIHIGRQITLTMPEQEPFAHAFQEVELVVYIGLIEDVAVYAELGRCAVEVGEDDAHDATGADRWFQCCLTSVLAAAYLLKTKAAGWELFCERWGALPFTAREAGLPGLARIRDALERAEKYAFTPKGMMRWYNANRPAGTPEVTEANIITAEKSAKNLELLFRQRVERWGG